MNLSFKIICAMKLSLFVSLTAFAQISYQKTFKVALQKATESNKPLFVNVGMPRQTTGVPVRSLADDPEVVDFYNKQFVNYLAAGDSPEFAAYKERYQLSSFPALFFLTAEGKLIYKSPKPASSAKEYVSYAQEALDRIKSGNSLSAYEEKHAAGGLSREELKKYITLRIQSGIFDNADLVERYVGFLTVAEFDDYQEVLFLLNAGPVAFGRAYGLAFTNRKITDSIYKYEPLNDRIAINNRIIGNTFNAAVAKKDHNLLNSLSTFIKNTHRPNFQEGIKQSTLKSLAFYKAVNDTNSYYSTAQYYYDQHYMQQNIDSLRKQSLKNRQARDEMKAIMEKSKAAGKMNPGPPVQSGRTVVRVVTTRVTVPGTNSSVANTLNSIAWDFYTMGTRNINHLSKAMQWSMRSIEIDPAPEHYDTLAHIFYRMGLFDEAILNQNKAIALLTKMPDQKQQLAEAKAQVAKMRERKL
jgi:hypothetical protein